MARKQSPSQTIEYPVSSVANGVSQQASTLRLPNQVQEALNIRSTVLGGVGPRNGTVHRGRYPIGTTDVNNAMRFQFDRAADGKYTGIATAQGLRIFNLDTYEEATVSYPDGMNFFTGLENPEKELSFVSAGNYMFLANSKTVPAMSAGVTAAEVNEAFIFFKASSYDQKLTVTLTNNSTGASYAWQFTGPTTAGAVAGALNNAVAAAAVQYGMVNYASLSPASQGVTNANQSWVLSGGSSVGAGAAGYAVEVFKNLIRVTRSDGADFALTIQDASGNGANIAGIRKVVRTVTDLPAVFWPWAIVRISGAANDTTLDYWVQYREQTADGKSSSGYWIEVPAPGSQYQINPLTMPFALQLVSRNVFTFGKVTWDNRICGSSTTLPPPSFVGSSITGLYFTRGRLGFVLPDGTVASRSDDNPFGFWRQSSTQLLDTDPIDLLNGTEDVVDIHSVCLVGQDPVMFSSKRQLALLAPQGNALSPNSAELMAVSAFQTPKGTAPPIAYGTTAFFASPGSSFTGVEQYVLNTDSNRPTGDSNPVTDHVPAYIPAKVWQFAECSSENLLFLIAGEDRNLVFTYQFLDTSDQGRVQSAWSKWAFDKECCILSLAIFDKMASLLICRDDAFYLEQMDLASDRLVGPTAVDTVLDRQRVPEEIIYDPSDGWTFIRVGWPITQEQTRGWFIVERNDDGTLKEVHDVSWRTDTLMKVNADLRSMNYIFGRAPRCYLELSEPVARPPGSDNSIYNDVTIKKVGPVFGQGSGCVMRIGYKSRRNYAKLLQVGQSLRWDGREENDMINAIPLSPAAGEYMYIFQAQQEDSAPRRFVTAGGRANDVIIAFENAGPRTFKVVGAVYILSVRPGHTGL
ncbi:phage nozzle protein